MKKSNYIILTIVGSILLFSLLPLFNYSVDRWRVLHSDYRHIYTGNNMSNKTFLKTKFLCETNRSYDAILMGSSACGYINHTLIAKRTYNMKYNFGLLAIHLQNLKTMIKKGVKIKELWVGINDYIIWKDPNDYIRSFERRTYKADLIENIKTYLFYLFKKPDITDWNMFKDPDLQSMNLIINPQPYLDAKERDLSHRNNLPHWQKNLDSSKPILLHYDDRHYRIDEAISEVKELVKVCKDNKIKLTIFSFPSWYKSQLEYNQLKIYEFKIKLAKITNFYDFYNFNDKSFDAQYWQDPMHFSLTYGDYIVKSIKNNKHLITSKNIKSAIEKDRENIIKYITSPTGKISSFNGNKNLTSMRKIFELPNKDLILTSKMSSYNYNNKKVEFYVNNKPYGIISNLIYKNSNQNNVIIQIDVITTQVSRLKLYYKNIFEDSYIEKNNYSIFLNKGINHILVSVPSRYLNNNLRIDFNKNRGPYSISKFILYE